MNKSSVVNQYNSVYIVLVLLCVAAFIYKPSYMQPENIYVMLRQTSALGILALGQMFVISAGGVDLSVVAIMQGSITIFMLSYNANGIPGLVIGILLSIIAGLIVGLINGVIITKFKVQPFLTTLFTGAILIGVRRVFSGVTPLGVAPEPIMQFVKGEQTGAFPYAALIFLAMAAIVYVVYNYTTYGRKIVAVGTNPTAALFAGYKVDRIRISTYCMCALAAVLSSIIMVGYTGYADQEALGKGMEMDSLVAVILGGTLLGGGRGSVSGTVGGVLVTTLIINIVILFGLGIQHQYIVKGLILLLVIFISSLVKRNSN